MFGWWANLRVPGRGLASRTSLSPTLAKFGLFNTSRREQWTSSHLATGTVFEKVL
jgi:hypothetical protein